MKLPTAALSLKFLDNLNDFFSHSSTEQFTKHINNCLFFVIQQKSSKSLENTYILTGLNPGTGYDIQVSTVTSFGSSPLTDPIQPVTDNEEFTVIDNLKKVLGINDIKDDINVIQRDIDVTQDKIETNNNDLKAEIENNRNIYWVQKLEILVESR